MPDISLKGKTTDLGVGAFSITRNIFLGSRGGLRLIAHAESGFSPLDIIFETICDDRGRVTAFRWSTKMYGLNEICSFTYEGELIKSVCFYAEHQGQERAVLNYENGKLVGIISDEGSYKVIYKPYSNEIADLKGPFKSTW
ncbi:MAG: hypothetical protein K6E59_06565 [Bacilli bacterium]|nr:hypothetical protein [Bacilli bacterium]